MLMVKFQLQLKYSEKEDCSETSFQISKCLSSYLDREFSPLNLYTVTDNHLC